MTLVELIEDYVPLRKAGGYRYAGPCPKCGGSPKSQRFSVRVGDKEFAHCYQCGFNADLVKALRELRGMSCPEAYAAAGQECDRSACPFSDKCRKGGNSQKRSSRYATPDHKERKPASFQPSSAEAPEEIWQYKAECLVVWAREQLLADPDQLAYLASRGLGKEEINRYWLGYVPKDIYRERSSWGLPEKLNKEGKAAKLWIPRGIVIPSFTGSTVQRVRVRRPNEDLERDRKRDPENDPLRYYAIPGSGNDVAVLGDTRRAAVVVESDLDGLLIDSVAGDIVSTIPLTTCSARPKENAARVLDEATVILVSTDADKPGALAFRWWEETYPGKAVRWPVRVGKDPGDAYEKGENLRAWITAGLPISLHPREEE